MKLTPSEHDRLTIFTMAELARRRHSRGLRLNHPEAVALICDEVLEAARDGMSYEEVVEHGRTVLSGEDVMEGVPEMIGVVQIEAMFADGSKLVSLRSPIVAAHIDMAILPGEVILAPQPIERLCSSNRTATVRVTNESNWPITVTSHFHFFEVNRRMRFDRAAAFGMHLDLVAGGSVRWKPGELKTVELVEYGGERTVYGYNGFANAFLGDQATFEQLRDEAVQFIIEGGYANGEP